MCMVDDCEPGEFYRETRPRARKTHKCHECLREIRVGETYRSVATKFDGVVETTKTCAHCEAAGEWLNERCNGYPIGMMREDLWAHWSDEGIHEMRLGRLIVSVKRGWRRRDGSMMPIPEIKSAAAMAAEREG